MIMKLAYDKDDKDNYYYLKPSIFTVFDLQSRLYMWDSQTTLTDHNHNNNNKKKKWIKTKGLISFFLFILTNKEIKNSNWYL